MTETATAGAPWHATPVPEVVGSPTDRMVNPFPRSNTRTIFHSPGSISSCHPMTVLELPDRLRWKES